MSYTDKLRRPEPTIMPWPHPKYTPMYSYRYRPHFWQKPYRGYAKRMVRRIALTIIFALASSAFYLFYLILIGGAR